VETCKNLSSTLTLFSRIIPILRYERVYIEIIEVYDTNSVFFEQVGGFWIEGGVGGVGSAI